MGTRERRSTEESEDGLVRSEPNRREITAMQFLSVGVGAAVAGLLFLLTGYPGVGVPVLVLGAVIGGVAWRYRSGRPPT